MAATRGDDGAMDQGTGLPEKGICAHRGDVKNAPENTLPAFAMAAEKGAHMVEFDVQMTADGALVVIHDETVDRTTDGSGRVREMTLAAIRRLDAGGWMGRGFAGTPVPTFREVLHCDLPGDIWLNVHTRSHAARDGEYLDRLIEAIAESGRQGQIVLACFADQAQVVRRALPDVKICNMTGQSHAGSDYPAASVELGADFIQLFGWHPSTADAAAMVHRHGLKVNYFKADEADEILRLFTIGVDFVLTDDLDAGLEAWRRFCPT